MLLDVGIKKQHIDEMSRHDGGVKVDECENKKDWIRNEDIEVRYNLNTN